MDLKNPNKFTLPKIIYVVWILRLVCTNQDLYWKMMSTNQTRLNHFVFLYESYWKE